MPFKPNYKQQRNERARAKEEKQKKKQQRREEVAAQRKAERGEGEPETAPEEKEPAV